MIRKECLDSLNLDIIGVAESHLLGQNSLEIDGYKWFGNNRKSVHTKARKGSGGVGIFVKSELFEHFRIEKLNDNTEGILWINLRPIHTGEQLKFCVCYLPPANSTRNVNSQEYFDLLMSQVYEYQHNWLITIFGDFNVRIGENEDFIAGVDNLPPRNVIDFQTNQY